MGEWLDSVGNNCVLGKPPLRIVSLVPSETELVAMLGAAERIVGRTDYCVEPADRVAAIPAVGGTKNASAAAIIALAPDLVLANREENTPAIVGALREARIAVYTSFPCSVAEAIEHASVVGAMLGGGAHVEALVRSMHSALETALGRARRNPPVPAFCPIWYDPWMTANRETFVSDVLRVCGAENVFAERARRYPLAADLRGDRASTTNGRDTRYPRVSLDEIVARRPDLVLLPDEPFAFGETEATVLRSAFEQAGHRPRITFIDGKALTWYSPRIVRALSMMQSVVLGPAAD